ncbi:nuclear transport factor 2 family protein [Pedobacter yulinensis]|uniref:Nuclear transport factor 2 family protein n=1 Tax=Pedobacter yulinensis TaxID=2126353 RepID=A0A2T3HL21_9SPHI|nr:nuclear transport factor 2 family protein [Pedobacter yulinensis]PST83130.1 nuclear transport factor 2 family protein [Pedobacter yulinensis]
MTDPNKFAGKWLRAWNAHDLDGVLAHFAEDVEIATPMIRIATGKDQDTLSGKEAVKNYWATALNKFPSLKFDMICVTAGVNSVALYYKTVMDKTAVEVMFFDQNGLVNRMHAFYSLDAGAAQ